MNVQNKNNGIITHEISALMKFLAIVNIIVCHLDHDFYSFIQIHHFVIPGNISVSIFFFLSAYGLTESESKKEHTVSYFIMHRIVRVLIPLVLIVPSLFLLLILLEQSGFDNNLVIKIITNNYWFVQAILIFYFLFIFSFKIFNKRVLKSLAILAVTIIYMVVAWFILKLPSYYVNAILAFPLGMIYSLYRNEIATKLQNELNLFLTVITGVLVMFVIGYYSPLKIIREINYALAINILLLLFYIKLSVHQPKISLKMDKIILILGAISYEMYLVHTWIIEYLKIQTFTQISFLLFIIITLIFSYFFNFVSKQIKLRFNHE
jgi:peptidoglycan/LPS O-acetylase OafA/YrhL